MANWTESMQQDYEYYIVDPATWADVKKLNNVLSCSITRDSETETLESATIDVTDSVGESYIRVYLITNQNGVIEKHPLGTFLAQTPSSSFNGRIHNYSIDAYSPLLELKENQPPIGYSIFKGANIMENAYMITRDNVRAPVIKTECSDTLTGDFVATSDETWLAYETSLISCAKHQFALDEMGRILFAPKQDLASLQPVWTYDDGNSSILLPDLDINRDLYGIPNVVEVIYSSGGDHYYARVVNDDPNSPISTVNRGREIVRRETNPNLVGRPTQMQIDEYATKLLRDLSALEYTITYTHGYCPVRLGDCVRLNYSRAGLKNVKAKVISQSIKCKPGCEVTEKAVFTTRLWGDNK